MKLDGIWLQIVLRKRLLRVIFWNACMDERKEAERENFDYAGSLRSKGWYDKMFVQVDIFVSETKFDQEARTEVLMFPPGVGVVDALL